MLLQAQTENDGGAPRLLAVEKGGRRALRDPNRFESIIRDAAVRL
jgi:hypothetical protein